MSNIIAEAAFATRQALDIASTKATERPASSRSRQTTRPSTSSSSLSSKSGKTKASTREGIASHVMNNLATLEPREKSRSPPTTMSNTRAPTLAHHERGRPLAPSSSWSSLKFSRKSSRESLVDDRNDAMGNRNQPLRRFQSLGFLRKKGSSISIAPSPSTSSLVSAPLQAGSSHGHSSSNSNSSNCSYSHQQQSRAQAIQPNDSHTVSASTVFPTMSSGTTFTLTLTPGKAPPSSSAKAAAVAAATPSFARPPKANPVSRRSISLYETSSSKADLPRSGSSSSRPSKKKVVPLPATKTTVVARAPCVYDVTATRPARPARPRSSSLPFDSALASRLEHMVSSAGTEAETVAQTASSLNTTTVLDATTSSTAMPPSSSTSTDRNATPSRTHHRYAAVYRPPPPVDANGHARPGHPKPALSLSMPSGVSIIEPLYPSKGTTASKPNASPSSPASTPLSSRPPPRAPIPVSPDASPERGLKPLPSLPPVSRSFGSPSPISSHPGSPWSRQRSESITKSPSIFSNRTGDGGNVTLNYASASPKIGAKSSHTMLNGTGSSPVSTNNSPKPSISDKYTVGSVRTVYSTTPNIPINTKRRPSLPLTSALRDSVDSYSTDQGDQLWGYFEKKGLTSSTSRSRSATVSPATPGVDLPPVAARGLARIDSERYTQTMYLPAQVHTPQTPSSLSTPPLTGGVSPVSPFHSKLTRQQRPETDSGVQSDRLQARGAQKKPHERPERLRPTHIISHSSAAALPSPSNQYSFLPSPAPSAFFSSGLTLPETPITPAPKSWTDLKSDADSMVLPPSPFSGKTEDAFYLDTARPRAATRAA